MTTVNGGGTHVVAVTGSLTLNDDGVGNVTLTDLSLSHVAYEVGLPPFIDIMITRPAINLGAGPVAGTGSFTTGATFGSTDIAQPGAGGVCTSGIVTCVSNGLPEGAFPLTSPLTGVPLGSWAILNNFLDATFQYGPTVSGSTDTLHLRAVPEPGTMSLVAIGLLCLAVRRRRSA